MRESQYLMFFFFQAEDGIRDYKVTGVQTCALPILRATCSWEMPRMSSTRTSRIVSLPIRAAPGLKTEFAPYGTSAAVRIGRSEERRVGKGCRARGERDEGRKNNTKVRVREDT